MELLIEDAKFFKQCIDAVVNLVDEGTFEVSATGLRLRTMDPSQIAMIDFFLPKEAFKKFDFEGTALLGINLADLSKVLGRARPKESLEIRWTKKSPTNCFCNSAGKASATSSSPSSTSRLQWQKN